MFHGLLSRVLHLHVLDIDSGLLFDKYIERILASDLASHTGTFARGIMLIYHPYHEVKCQEDVMSP